MLCMSGPTAITATDFSFHSPSVFLQSQVVVDFSGSRWRWITQFLFPEEVVLPGSKVNLKLEAAPGALCSLQAVDKSVLLKEDKTLTPEDVRKPFLLS